MFRVGEREILEKFEFHNRLIMKIVLLLPLLPQLLEVLGGRLADGLEQRPGDGHLRHTTVPQYHVLHHLVGLDPQLRDAVPPLHHPLGEAHAPLQERVAVGDAAAEHHQPLQLHLLGAGLLDPVSAAPSPTSGRSSPWL